MNWKIGQKVISNLTNEEARSIPVGTIVRKDTYGCDWRVLDWYDPRYIEKYWKLDPTSSKREAIPVEAISPPAGFSENYHINGFGSGFTFVSFPWKCAECAEMRDDPNDYLCEACRGKLFLPAQAAAGI